MSIHVIGFFYFLPEIPHYKFVGFFKKRMMFWSLIGWGFCYVSAETNMHLMMSERIAGLDNRGQVEDVNKVLFCNCTFFPPTCSVPAVSVHACFLHSAPILCLESPVIFQSYKTLLIPTHQMMSCLLSKSASAFKCLYVWSQLLNTLRNTHNLISERILVWMKGRN